MWLELIAVTAGVFTSVSFITVGASEFDLTPAVAGLIMFFVGLVLAFLKNTVLQFYGYGIVGGAVSLLAYYYMPRTLVY